MDTTNTTNTDTTSNVIPMTPPHAQRDLARFTGAYLAMSHDIANTIEGDEDATDAAHADEAQDDTQENPNA